MCKELEVEEILFNLQPMTKVLRPSCWHQNFGPYGLSTPAYGLRTSIKIMKNMDKIRGQSYFVKHATSDQTDNTFLLP